MRVLETGFRFSARAASAYNGGAISLAQIFRSGQDHFQPTVSRYSWVHHCNHLVLVLDGKCEREWRSKLKEHYSAWKGPFAGRLDLLS